MKTLNDLRKAIKPLGFTVITKTLSWGRHASYKHVESGQINTFNVYDAAAVERWKPLCDFLKEHEQEIKALQESTGVIGLRKLS